VHKYTFGYETYVDGTFTILMEQRKGNASNIPANARVRIVHVIITSPHSIPPHFFDDINSHLDMNRKHRKVKQYGSQVAVVPVQMVVMMLKNHKY
jgi:hypothetical protein